MLSEKYPTKTSERILGYASGLISFLCAFVGVLFPLPLLYVCVRPISKRLYSRIVAFCSRCWYTLNIILMEGVLGLRIYTNALECMPKIPKDHSVIFLCNHRTRVDWFLLWCVQLRYHHPIFQNIKIITTKMTGQLPVYGYAMRHFNFIFLHRNRELDGNTLRSKFAYYNRYESRPFTIVLFPEGTDLSEKNILASIEYSQARGLPTFRQVLHPKSGALMLAVDEIRRVDHDVPITIVDCTLGYMDYVPGERPNVRSLFNGRIPRELHAHLRIVPWSKFTQISENESSMREWLQQSFQQKEDMLSNFYLNDPVGFPATYGVQESRLLEIPGIWSMLAQTVLFWIGIACFSMWLIVCSCIPGWLIVSYMISCIVVYEYSRE